MSDPVLAAFLGLFGVIAAALLSVFGVVLGLLWRRLIGVESTNNSLWLYTRVLIDAYYTDVKRAPPPPPEHIAHLYQASAQ